MRFPNHLRASPGVGAVTGFYRSRDSVHSGQLIAVRGVSTRGQNEQNHETQWRRFATMLDRVAGSSFVLSPDFVASGQLARTLARGWPGQMQRSREIDILAFEAELRDYPGAHVR